VVKPIDRYYKRCYVEQSKLNKIQIDEWDDEGLYKQLFSLKLTSTNALAVGRWTNGGDWGVDLRRWSYNKSKLLGEGITLNSDKWDWLSAQLIQLDAEGLFSQQLMSEDEFPSATVKIDKNFSVQTAYFLSKIGDQYYCVNLLNSADKMVWKSKIMIRFDTVHDFLIKSQVYELIVGGNFGDDHSGKIDPKTGKKIF
jgi:hypothetical protein